MKKIFIFLLFYFIFIDLYASDIKFEKITDVPVIINTSMNVMGEPIVNTPKEAYNMILKTDMDYIVLGNNLISR